MDKSGANKAGIDTINLTLALLFMLGGMFTQLTVRQIKYLNNISVTLVMMQLAAELDVCIPLYYTQLYIQYALINYNHVIFLTTEIVMGEPIKEPETFEDLLNQVAEGSERYFNYLRDEGVKCLEKGDTDGFLGFYERWYPYRSQFKRNYRDVDCAIRTICDNSNDDDKNKFKDFLKELIEIFNNPKTDTNKLASLTTSFPATFSPNCPPKSPLTWEYDHLIHFTNRVILNINVNIQKDEARLTNKSNHNNWLALSWNAFNPFANQSGVYFNVPDRESTIIRRRDGYRQADKYTSESNKDGTLPVVYLALAAEHCKSMTIDFVNSLPKKSSSDDMVNQNKTNDTLFSFIGSTIKLDRKFIINANKRGFYELIENTGYEQLAQGISEDLTYLAKVCVIFEIIVGNHHGDFDYTHNGTPIDHGYSENRGDYHGGYTYYWDRTDWWDKDVWSNDDLTITNKTSKGLLDYLFLPLISRALISIANQRTDDRENMYGHGETFGPETLGKVFIGSITGIIPFIIAVEAARLSIGVALTLCAAIVVGIIDVCNYVSDFFGQSLSPGSRS